MKKISALKYAVGASVVVLAAACSKKEEAPEAQVAVSEPVVQEIAAVCDEPSLRNRLVDALQAGLLDQALAATQNYDDASRLGLEQQVRQKLTEVNIDLQNVVASGATCQADVQFTLPSQDVAYANQVFESSGLAPLDEQAAEAGAALVGGHRLMVKGFTYTIEDNKAIIGTDNAILTLVADTLVAATHGMADDSHTHAQNAPTVRLEPVTPIATPRIQQPEVRERESRPAEVQRPEVKTRTEVRTETTTQPRPKREPVNTNNVENTSTRPAREKAASDTPSVKSVRTEQTKTVVRTEQSSNAQPSVKTSVKAAEPKATPAAEPRSDSAPAAQPAANSGEITIVETNDTY